MAYIRHQTEATLKCVNRLVFYILNEIAASDFLNKKSYNYIYFILFCCKSIIKMIKYTLNGYLMCKLFDIIYKWFEKKIKAIKILI